MATRMTSFVSRASRIVPVLIVLLGAIPVMAEVAAGSQVLVETWMLRLDSDKIPADIKRILAQEPTQSMESFLLTPQQQDNLLKAASSSEGQVIACPALLMQAGSEAEIRTLRLRSYVASVEPTPVNNGHMYTPDVKDAEDGLTLKVKAEPSADGKYFQLTFSPKLASTLELRTFSFDQGKEAGRLENRLAIQQPITQEVSIETTVNVPDGKTLLLGGQIASPAATSSKSSVTQTLLFLVRAAAVGPETLPKGNLPDNTTFAVQAKFLTVPSDFPPDFRNTYLPSNKPPLLDDAQAEAMIKAVERSAGRSVMTSPRVILGSGASGTTACTRPTSYVGGFSLAKNLSGQPVYTPQIKSIEEGHTVNLRATAVPERNAATISADITFTDLLAMEPFSFVEKPEKITLQQPTRQILSANVQACIPDKHWLVIGPLRVHGRIETQVRPSFLSRLVGGKPKLVERPAAFDTYILIRPEAQAAN